MNDSIVIQRPITTRTAELLLLFHGFGSNAEDLVPLGQVLAAQRPAAWVVSIRSPDPSDLGEGWQWFSVRGITEENRQARVIAAMPAFLGTVAGWQNEAGLGPAATALIGFSQGATMALASTQAAAPPAQRVIAIAGRLAQAPTVAPKGTSVHLLHGELDAVMRIRLAVDAQSQLEALGVPTTLDRFPGLAHGIDARVVERIDARLGVAPFEHTAARSVVAPPLAVFTGSDAMRSGHSA